MSRKVYTVVESGHKHELEAKVNELLVTGEWVVVGGISHVNTQGNYSVYSQALVRSS